MRYLSRPATLASRRYENDRSGYNCTQKTWREIHNFMVNKMDPFSKEMINYDSTKRI